MHFMSSCKKQQYSRLWSMHAFLFIITIALTMSHPMSTLRLFPSVLRALRTTTATVPRLGSFLATHHALHSSSSSSASNGITEVSFPSVPVSVSPSVSPSESVSVSPSPSTLANFYSTSNEQLTSVMQSWGQPAFRVKQIQKWVYEKGAQDFMEMNDLPIDLRERLSAAYSIGSLRIVSEQVSKDGTIKRAYALHDNQLIESVLMPYDDGRRTACISSQAGCAMGCVFCATGQMGFSRQLTSAEIFEQAQQFSAELKRKGERLSNVVFMGMGEPLANYENVLKAIKRLNEELGIGARHITVSTVGLAPRIRKLANETIQVGLAISLHQANDAKRTELMPVNKRYPIAELLDACRYYIEKTNRRISFEWALIRDQTDTPETAHELGTLLEGMLCHVNVIPLNPTKGFDGKPTSKDGVARFIDILALYGVTATPRTRRGIDIDAGCGQLKAELLRRRPIQAIQAAGIDAAGTDSEGRL